MSISDIVKIKTMDNHKKTMSLKMVNPNKAFIDTYMLKMGLDEDDFQKLVNESKAKKKKGQNNIFYHNADKNKDFYKYW